MVSVAWTLSQGSPAALRGQAAPITISSSHTELRKAQPFSACCPTLAWMAQPHPGDGTAPVPQAQGGNPW